MSSQPFKFRHLDHIVGGFVLGAVGVVVAALLLVGYARQWFSRISTVQATTVIADPGKADFLDELSESLRPGTPVELAGQVVGKVASAHTDSGFLRLKLALEDAALRTLGSDAKAVIKVPLAPFMGQTRIVIKAGRDPNRMWPTDERTWPEEQSIPIEPPRDSTAMVMAVLRDLEANLDPLLKGITATLNESRGLLAEVRTQKLPERATGLLDDLRASKLPERTVVILDQATAIAKRAEAIANEAERLIGGLGAGKGLAGRVLADEKLAADLAGIVNDLHAIIGEVRKVAPAAPALAESGQALLEDARRLVDGLSRHWLLRAYTTPPEPGRIAPSGAVTPGVAP